MQVKAEQDLALKYLGIQQRRYRASPLPLSSVEPRFAEMMERAQQRRTDAHDKRVELLRWDLSEAEWELLAPVGTGRFVGVWACAWLYITVMLPICMKCPTLLSDLVLLLLQVSRAALFIL